MLPPSIIPPLEPKENPTTVEKVALGKALFFDPRLSADSRVSCATCHKPEFAFADSVPFSMGVFQSVGVKNSPSLLNSAYFSTFTWGNPLFRNLETQLAVPLLGDNPLEHGLGGNSPAILDKISEDEGIQKLVENAFYAKRKLSMPVVIQALASYVRTLVQFDSPWDKRTFNHELDAMSESSLRGEILFMNTLNCGSCHVPPHFSDATHDKGRDGLVNTSPFHNTGLYNIDGKGGYPFSSTGILDITENAKDMGRFRTPSLRNVAKTAPYMHDGSIITLSEVIDHYAAGGRTLEAGEHTGVGSENPFKDNRISGFAISETEKNDLLNFLKSLTSSGVHGYGD